MNIDKYFEEQEEQEEQEELLAKDFEEGSITYEEFTKSLRNLRAECVDYLKDNNDY